MQNGEPHLACRVRGCKKSYSAKKGNTSNLVTHLKQDHSITSSSPPNTGQKRDGPMDVFIGQAQQQKNARIFSRDEFDQLVSRFIVRARLPFSIVEQPEFQQLLSYAASAPNLHSVKLLSADAATSQVKFS